MLEATKNLETPLNRRRFLYFTGWGCIGIFLMTLFGGVMRFFFPRTIVEPPTRYKIGYPSQYTLGVSERFKKQFRIWIVREADRLYVIEAKCTHLGCTPNWLAAEGKFKCPCHGSGFTPDGINIEGPAPRPMERFKVMLETDGQIIVDAGVRFRGERGEWDKPGAFLKV
ncbi:MAG: Rieske 2Fe-2S domain-containing protein [Planctomycetia bacterium]|uniref:Rieske (2Fe-2S) protein n=2 Tax=Candidatus Brocadia sapporoensis TaxID=392547 RepID=A0A1V6LZ23_9BACT|nr:Rieske 2Fe-2S domain-containing protein [Candidatus Brocadia sp.]OQD45422.1 Rieske (2Fe-2S) protein [Candidatus Brocadia sapporoensis]QOJ07376.1 MAG: Rieske 2Fe-2S domain-containing protein [Planctomycetia bacterium]TVL98258.1 MAG: Rieske (2Fe-2S) protein [Candidatus Brocadia sp. BL1]MDG6005296.1 Rieske (2Fe-2S) protein [Candidatus Brocadia sp.]